MTRTGNGGGGVGGGRSQYQTRIGSGSGGGARRSQPTSLSASVGTRPAEWSSSGSSGLGGGGVAANEDDLTEVFDLSAGLKKRVTSTGSSYLLRRRPLFSHNFSRKFCVFIVVLMRCCR
jgi:hypothetical protein